MNTKPGCPSPDARSASLEENALDSSVSCLLWVCVVLCSLTTELDAHDFLAACCSAIIDASECPEADAEAATAGGGGGADVGAMAAAKGAMAAC